VRTLCARRENVMACRERAVNTLQQLLARCENVMDAVKTLWERRVDAVRTLCTRYNWQFWYFKPLSHQTAMPQRLYSVLKPCQRAVGSPRNTPKISNFTTFFLFFFSTYRTQFLKQNLVRHKRKERGLKWPIWTVEAIRHSILQLYKVTLHLQHV